MPTLVIPIHRGKPVKEGTLRGILSTAGIPVDLFLRQY
jgi:predicted RNA binding protein YcfA (HicA-like mRNA interferase family)